MSSDPLSDVLQLTEARSVIAGGLMGGGKWALHFPPPGEIKFFVIVKGEGWLRLDDQATPVKFAAGDVALLPGLQGFVAATHLDATPQDAMPFFASREGIYATIGDGSECTILAGGASLHPSSAAFFTSALPPLVHIRASSPGAASLRWIVEQIVQEGSSGSPGARIASTQLAQLLFTQIFRASMASAEPSPVGWLRALRDKKVAPALRLMHGDPKHPWKLEELAKAAGMSRTSFAVHFKAVAGTAPLTYLAEWRMRLAEKLLRQDATSVSEIAAALGYTSESAFSQAYKRVTGARPSDSRTIATKV